MEPRRSLRQRGVASDGVSVVEELRGGAVTTNILLPAEPAKPKERHPKGAAAGVQHVHCLTLLRCCTAGRVGLATLHCSISGSAHGYVFGGGWNSLAQNLVISPTALACAGEVALEDSNGAGPDVAFLAELRARAAGAAERPSVQQVATWRCGEDDIAKARGLPAQRVVVSAVRADC